MRSIADRLLKKKRCDDFTTFHVIALILAGIMKS